MSTGPANFEYSLKISKCNRNQKLKTYQILGIMYQVIDSDTSLMSLTHVSFDGIFNFLSYSSNSHAFILRLTQLTVLTLSRHMSIFTHSATDVMSVCVSSCLLYLYIDKQCQMRIFCGSVS